MPALHVDGKWFEVSICPDCKQVVLVEDGPHVVAPCGRKLFMRPVCPSKKMDGPVENAA